MKYVDYPMTVSAFLKKKNQQISDFHSMANHAKIEIVVKTMRLLEYEILLHHIQQFSILCFVVSCRINILNSILQKQMPNTTHYKLGWLV